MFTFQYIAFFTCTLVNSFEVVEEFLNGVTSGLKCKFYDEDLYIFLHFLLCTTKASLNVTDGKACVLHM
jgi:hypothetical protein